MKSLKFIFSIVWNKYLIVVVIFAVWMLFFDNNSYLSHRNLNAELAKVTKEKMFYLQEIEQDSKRTNDLMSDDNNLERFAREQYLMKRDNEDIYLIIE